MAVKRKSISTKKSKTSISVWIFIRKLLQYCILILFIILFVLSRRGGLPANFVNIFMRFDLLLIISNIIATREIIPSEVLAITSLFLALIVGRAWCGWFCPFGTILDIFPLRRKQKLKAPYQLSKKWRSVKYVILLSTLFAAFFGNLTLLIFDPLTLLFRTLTVSVWPALDRIVRTTETTLYNLGIFPNIVSVIDRWLRPAIFPIEQVYYQHTLLIVLIFFTIICLNIFAFRFWCRYLCPLGALLGLISKISLVRREISSNNCKGCSLCEYSCPTGTINPKQNFFSDPSECTMCLECLDVCPSSSIVFKFNRSPAKWQDYDLGRRQTLVTLGITIASLAIIQTTTFNKREHLFNILPPGGRENELVKKCIRCGECIQACPTSGLQVAITETSLEGLLTPVLVPRLGYCDYSCNACGQICPVGAIPSLTLEEKRNKVLGVAHIDRNRCLPWANHIDCIICEEMCPVPGKAIKLIPETKNNENNEIVTILLPQVIADLCIGCGICEYRCPVNGKAAIRVYIPPSEVFT